MQISTDPLCTLTAHSGDVNCVTFNDRFMASCSGDKAVRLFDWTEVTEQRPFLTEATHSPLLGHSFYVNFGRFSPLEGSDELVTCSTDGRIILWNTKTGKKVAVLSHNSMCGVRAAVFSQDGAYLASGAEDGSVCVWRCPGGGKAPFLLHSYPAAHEASVLGLAFPPDSNLLISSSANGDIRCWWPTNHNDVCAHRRLDCHDLGVTAMDIAPDYEADLKTGSRHYLMATCGSDNLVILWNLNLEGAGGNTVSIEPKQNLIGHSLAVMCCVFSKDGSLLATCAGDHLLILWDPSTGCQLHRLEAHSRYVTSCAFSPDLRFLATGSNDRTVKVWRLHGATSPGRNAVAQATDALPLTDLGVPPMAWPVERVVTFFANLGLHFLAPRIRNVALDGERLLKMKEAQMVQELGIVDPPTRTLLTRALSELRDAPMMGCNPRLRVRPPTLAALVPLPSDPDACSLRATGAAAPPNDLEPEHEAALPAEFFCPITCEVMRDPVIASDGFSYERQAIAGWLSRGKLLSPMTCEPLTNRSLIANHSLRQLINREKQRVKATSLK